MKWYNKLPLEVQASISASLVVIVLIMAILITTYVSDHVSTIKLIHAISGT